MLRRFGLFPKISTPVEITVENRGDDAVAAGNDPFFASFESETVQGSISGV